MTSADGTISPLLLFGVKRVGVASICPITNALTVPTAVGPDPRQIEDVHTPVLSQNHNPEYNKLC